MHPALLIFLVLLIWKIIFELILERLNCGHVREASGRAPRAYGHFIDQETYDRSIEYTLAKSRFGTIETVYDGLILGAVILLGFLPWLYRSIQDWIGSGVWTDALNLCLIGIVLALPGLPWNWWNQFRLEERFGFNKSSQKLWFSDRVKGLLVGFLIGYPMLCVILWLMQLPNWWVYAFAVVFLFQLVMMVVYPMFIMPLFNKFEPLPEGELRDRLMDLSERTGFRARTILVMDGSRRSAHSNAFFTGFGRFRRIVLFDTLLEQLKTPELEAVLAHEIGHYKLGHVPKRLALSAFSTLFGFIILAWLVQRPWFYEGFDFSASWGMAPALLLFGILSGLVTYWLNPLLNSWSRKHEYEADQFALAAMHHSEPLIGALQVLHEKNLSNLNPHPIYSRFYYSHPTLLERESALAAGEPNG